jgi:Haem-degrading
LSFTMENARALVDAAVEAALKRGYLISAAVVDSSGNLMWSGKMDGAKFVSPDIARAGGFYQQVRINQFTLLANNVFFVSDLRLSRRKLNKRS